MTPYQPADSDGYGYKSQQLDDDSVRVSFEGNANTEKETVRNYLLYRAAEITLEQGGDYFIIASQNTESEVQHRSTSLVRPFYTTGFSSGTVLVQAPQRAPELFLNMKHLL